MRLRSTIQDKQDGLSLVGFMFVTAIVAVLVVLGMKVVPSVIEYTAIKKALTNAAVNASSPRDIQVAFDKQRDAGYIESVTGKDLEITKTPEGFDVSVAYEKRIGLIGPASLVIDYVASNGGKPMQKAAE